MWKITKIIITGDKFEITKSYRFFKYRYIAIIYLNLIASWDADEEYGMMGEKDSYFKIVYSLEYVNK